MNDEKRPEDQAEPPPAYDASDKNAVEKKKAESKRKEAKRLSGLRQLCESADGRAWLWELLRVCGFASTSFSSDALKMAFKEGERNVALRIMAEIHRVAPETYLRMQKENATDE